MQLHYKIGDATKPDVHGKYWILQGNNSIGAWGAGFVIALNDTFGTKDGSPMKEYLR